MKRFTVAITGGGGAIAPWLDTGFVDFAPVVADAVYRHLLADVFRETAEWCGHTFSVVTSF